MNTINCEQEARYMFEEIYLGDNKHAARMNEHGDYVHPSIQDAWAGWKALWVFKFAHMYSEK